MSANNSEEGIVGVERKFVLKSPDVVELKGAAAKPSASSVSRAEKLAQTSRIPTEASTVSGEAIHDVVPELEFEDPRSQRRVAAERVLERAAPYSYLIRPTDSATLSVISYVTNNTRQPVHAPFKENRATGEVLLLRRLNGKPVYEHAGAAARDYMNQRGFTEIKAPSPPPRAKTQEGSGVGGRGQRTAKEAEPRGKKAEKSGEFERKAQQVHALIASEAPGRYALRPSLTRPGSYVVVYKDRNDGLVKQVLVERESDQKTFSLPFQKTPDAPVELRRFSSLNDALENIEDNLNLVETLHSIPIF